MKMNQWRSRKLALEIESLPGCSVLIAREVFLAGTKIRGIGSA